VGQLRLFAEVVREGSWCEARIDTALPERTPLPRPDLRSVLVPLGPVVVFGASNFPLAFSVAGGDTASAFAVGCPVVVKGHPAHPGTGELVAGAIYRALQGVGLPAGIFSFLQGRSHGLGQALVQHPKTRAVGFTGSHRGGRALLDAANARLEPIPVFAEMSSLNPVFVLPGALRERGRQIAQGLKNSLTMGVGQFCTKPGLVFVAPGEGLAAFREELALAIQGAPCGTMLHTGISGAFASGLEQVLSLPGVSALARAEVSGAAAPALGRPVVLEASAEAFASQSLLREELFGPASLLVETKDGDGFGQLAACLEGQLTATVHATESDLAGAEDLLAILERKAGRVLLNGFPTGVEVCHAMQHGGPYPASSDGRFTSVGTAALRRWVRPVCYQNFPGHALPAEVQNENPLGLLRLVNGHFSRESL
jgi:NADP-dependent aldehyde dehydrogenase